MSTDGLAGTWARRAARWTAFTAALLTAGLSGAAGCGDGGGGDDDDSSSTMVQRVGQGSVQRIDLLLAIDNSRSMADKQTILSLAVPDLVNELVNPWCVDSAGSAVERPAGPLDECPAGTTREFEPIVDIHVGVVTSSLGDHGGDTCPEDVAGCTNNDMARLIDRDMAGGTVPTYEDQGFLAWDPAQQLVPPGDGDVNHLIGSVSDLVEGAGELGCGFEAQLESWYRFLIDPDPYLTIEPVAGEAVMAGTDDVLLAQRADFLRPDSLVAIVMLSDENDCSMRDGSQYFYAATAQAGSGQYHLPKPQITCASNPEDDCCRSCGQTDEGCPPKGTECDGALDALADAINLRCFNQKQRFGIDFLQPVDRYVTGLTSFTVPDRDGNLAANPLFSDLDPNDDLQATRDPSLVVLAGIVGVPWQDIARRTAAGQPDLLAGQDADGDPVGGFQSADELVSNGTWDLILGDPSCYVTDPDGCLPQDPLMIESVDPRSGTHPLTGDALAPPGAGYLANPINGHEWSSPLLDQRNDLQYACIFPLDDPRDCSDPSQNACDCTDPANDNPLCQDSTGAFGITQYSGKAYPSRRELEVIRAIGAQGIVASICPAQQADNARTDFGYRPAVGAVVERLKGALRGRCFPRTLSPDANGQVPCRIVEARHVGSACGCNESGRQPISSDREAILAAIEQDPLYAVARWDCFCEITQLTGDGLAACQTDLNDCPSVAGALVHGWCYVDAATNPPLGNPELVAACPETDKRMVRFVCDGKARPGATVFISCGS